MTKEEQIALLIPYFEKKGFVSKGEYKSDPDTPIPLRKIERLFKRFTRMQLRVKEAIAVLVVKPKFKPMVKPKQKEIKDGSK